MEVVTTKADIFDRPVALEVTLKMEVVTTNSEYSSVSELLEVTLEMEVVTTACAPRW